MEKIRYERRKLEKVLEIYHALKLSCKLPRDSIKRSSWQNFAHELAIKTGRTVGDVPYSKKELEDLFDNSVTPILYEISFLDLVRVFEHIVFDLVDNASGKIEKIIKESKEAYPFHRCAASFVKSPTKRDITNLGHIQEILAGHLTPDLDKKLDRIVKYRNWLAHGNRFKYEDRKDQPTPPGEIEEIAEILEEILRRIRPNS
jgi:hypothetical protein|uniref:HEPN domain-containing protein n=1 Tax=Desulfomonile tiedjei TaxID=2358 RepID=A0A7C4ARL4_9BACT